MALREETAIENEVSYEGSLGRASLRGPIQSLNAPRTVSETQVILRKLLDEVLVNYDTLTYA